MDIPLAAVRQCLEEESLPAELEQLSDNHRKDFCRWMLYLSEGFGVLLQGFGSKRQLLEEFAEQRLAEESYAHLVVRGYEPTVSARQILLTLAENWGVDLKQSVNVVEMANSFRKEIGRRQISEDVVLVLHNIDGPSLREEEDQNVLSILAAIDNLHMIASVDNINAFCLWDEVKLARFRWVHIDATTFRTYSKEFVAGESNILGLTNRSANRKHTVASLDSVWAALSRNSRNIFLEICRYCFENPSKVPGTFKGITFSHLYKECRGEFLVSSEAGLNHVMVEFQDHYVVTKKKAPDGSDIFQLTVDFEILCHFLKSQGHEDLIPEDSEPLD